MPAILTKQPIKGLYVFLAIAFELSRMPYFLLKYIFSYGRPHQAWTLRQAFGMRMFSSLLYHIASFEIITPLPLTPRPEKERWVTMKPAEDEMYQGPLRSNNNVKPVEIGGTWYPASLTLGSEKNNIKIFLHIHGGAFVTGDGRTEQTGYCANMLLKHATATHVFCPQYRLSTLPVSTTSNPFPAAIQDCLTSYLYLVRDLKLSPKDIVLSGDSAGGNLAISLLKYIVDYGSELGISKPSACLLWSPWINPADTSSSFVYDNENYRTDYLAPVYQTWGTTAYAGIPGLSTLSQPYISHKKRAFKTDVPIWVNTGGAEILTFDHQEWTEGMKAAGNDVTLFVEKNAPHDTLLVGNLIGFDKELRNSAKEAGEWLRNRTRYDISDGQNGF
jgi:acetyl esterase/lipase